MKYKLNKKELQVLGYIPNMSLTTLNVSGPMLTAFFSFCI